MIAPAEPWEAFADALLYTEAAVARIGRGDPTASLSGLFVDDADLGRLLADLPGLRGPEPEEAAAVRAKLTPGVASAREALSAAAQQPSSVFDAICWNAGLSTDEVEVFAVLCAVALHPGRQRLVGYLHDDMTRQQVTPWLLAQMFPPPHLADLVVTPDASLGRAALVRSDHTASWVGSPIEVPAMLAWTLRGSGSSDPALPRATYLAGGAGGGEARLVLVTGGDRSSRVRVATEAATGSAFLVSFPPAVPEGWEALIRQATVMGASIVLEVEDRISTEARWWVDHARHLTWAISSPVELQVESLPRRDWVEVSVETAEATAADWMEELGTAPLPGHQLTLDELRQVAQTAPGVGGDLTTAIRRVAAGHLGRLALRIRPQRSWGDLVLPPDQMSQLRELASRYRHRSLVYDDWGFRPIPSPGLVALFAGPSGTGKTLAAEVVTGELGLDLYKVDLSSVVSKYVGETEKNLAELFDQAVGGNVVLFFDEADSLFGKRTDVSDAHDRYANIEVSYLLQRLERHEGLVVLATNLQRNIDQAFLRRIHVAVEFPAPEEDERLAIWSLSFPPEAPIGPLDLGFLARQFKVPGGSIRNAALHAAFLAAEESEPITMEHVIHGMKREFQKLGRLRTETDFDRYFSLVKGEQHAAVGR